MRTGTYGVRLRDMVGTALLLQEAERERARQEARSREVSELYLRVETEREQAARLVAEIAILKVRLDDANNAIATLKRQLIGRALDTPSRLYDFDADNVLSDTEGPTPTDLDGSDEE